jgi:PAS domain S-box-containing protein
VSRGRQGTLEFEMITLKGARRWLESHAVPLRDDTTGQTLVLSVTRDITERKEANERLRESEERFARAFRSAPEAMTISTLDRGRYLEVNEAFTAMTGYTAEEVIGRSAIELGIWQDPVERESIVATLKSEGRVLARERKSNDERWADLTVAPIEFSGTPARLCTAFDVTERKEYEDALAESETRTGKWSKPPPTPFAGPHPKDG